VAADADGGAVAGGEPERLVSGGGGVVELAERRVLA